jgi:hypothetical protein
MRTTGGRSGQERPPKPHTFLDSTAVHWKEEAYFYPPAKFIAQANAADPAISERFSEPNFSP